MSIKSQGGVFGRNPTFNDVTVDGDLSIAGTLSIGGETITGLSYQGGWNADTNTPDIANIGAVTGQFWIVSTAGSTNVGGITNWTQGDWALYDGSNWQRVEGGNTDLSTGVQGQLAVSNGGTGAADAATARTNLGLGTAATTASTDYATAAQGALADSALQSFTETDPIVGAVNGIVKADGAGNISAATASTDYLVPSDISNMLETTDIGSTVQAYDADTTKNDVSNTFTQNQIFNGNVGIGNSNPTSKLEVLAGVSNTEVAVFSGINPARGLSISTTADGGLSEGGVDYNAQTATYGVHTFSIAGSEKLRILPSGGITFNGDTTAANALDDYEEGTWTPVLTPGSGSFATMTMDIVRATYVKVGKLVTVSCFIRTDNVDTTGASGALYLSGLPYTSSSTCQAVGVISATDAWSGDYPITGSIGANASTVLLYYRSSANTIDLSLQVADLTNGASANKNRLALTISYEAA